MPDLKQIKPLKGFPEKSYTCVNSSISKMPVIAEIEHQEHEESEDGNDESSDHPKLEFIRKMHNNSLRLTSTQNKVDAFDPEAKIHQTLRKLKY